MRTTHFITRTFLMIVLILMMNAVSLAQDAPSGNASHSAPHSAPRLPGFFDLLSPVDHFIDHEGESLNFYWEAAAGADYFRFIIFPVTSWTPTVEGQKTAASLCNETVCTLGVDLSTLNLDTYRWEVIAGNGGGELKSMNGPYFFTIDPDGLNTGIELLTNGDFEAKNGGEWVRINPTRAKIKCNTETRSFTPFGECAAMVRPDGVLKQRVNVADLGLELTTDHQLRLELDYATTGTGLVRVIAKRFDGTKQKMVETVAQINKSEYFGFYTDANLTEPVKTVIIQLRSTSGKVFYDNVSVKRAGAVHRLKTLPLPPAS